MWTYGVVQVGTCRDSLYGCREVVFCPRTYGCHCKNITATRPQMGLRVVVLPSLDLTPCKCFTLMVRRCSFLHGVLTFLACFALPLLFLGHCVLIYGTLRCLLRRCVFMGKMSCRPQVPVLTNEDLSSSTTLLLSPRPRVQ